MVLGILLIIFIFLAIIAVVVQVLLYGITEESKYSNLIFIVNTVLGVILSVLAFTALPSNFIGLKALAAVWGLIAVLALILKLTNKRLIMIGKLMLTIAIVGSIVQLFS